MAQGSNSLDPLPWHSSHVRRFCLSFSPGSCAAREENLLLFTSSIYCNLQLFLAQHVKKLDETVRLVAVSPAISFTGLLDTREESVLRESLLR
eukprot:SAG31_NODE_1011_length_10382_cov_8.910240_12_plen_93_part_00